MKSETAQILGIIGQMNVECTTPNSPTQNRSISNIVQFCIAEEQTTKNFGAKFEAIISQLKRGENGGKRMCDLF
jgi:hypothetical protein